MPTPRNGPRIAPPLRLRRLVTMQCGAPSHSFASVLALPAQCLQTELVASSSRVGSGLRRSLHDTTQDVVTALFDATRAKRIVMSCNQWRWDFDESHHPGQESRVKVERLHRIQ
jgi:hypothetical protein